MCSWRAGCGGTRTSGSEGGGEETTGRKAGTGASPPTLRDNRTAVVTHCASRLATAPAPTAATTAYAEPGVRRVGRRFCVKTEATVRALEGVVLLRTRSVIGGLTLGDEYLVAQRKTVTTDCDPRASNDGFDLLDCL